MNWNWTIPVALSLTAPGCGPDAHSAHGFRLPAGDVEAGKAAFVELGCVRCHTVEGTEFPAGEGAAEGEREVLLQLGGKVHRVRTYGELVTSIIHPSEELAREFVKKQGGAVESSPMASVNGTMTVQQMVDLVVFLQSTYEEYLPRDYDPYFP